MTRAVIERFFDEYVDWMRRDIDREISWWRDNKQRDTGNLLCALGLLVYTEALGRLREYNVARSQFNDRDSEGHFYSMFDRLGGGQYGAWRTKWEADRNDETTIYEILRCGMVHEYLPKVYAKIWMGEERRRGVDFEEDVLGFYVIPYFDDFRVAADLLRREILDTEDPDLPHPHLKIANAIYTPRPISSVSGSSAVASGADMRTGPDWKRREELRGRDEQ